MSCKPYNNSFHFRALTQVAYNNDKTVRKGIRTIKLLRFEHTQQVYIQKIQTVRAELLLVFKDVWFHVNVKGRKDLSFYIKKR